MSFPEFYSPEKVGKMYIPDVSSAIQSGKAIRQTTAKTDSKRTALLLIDAQVDFVHEDGALCVPGAIADTRRIIEWIFENVQSLTSIFASLDSHLPIQIFSPSWWVDSDGNHPQPFTAISQDDVKSGKWKPLYQAEWSVEYVTRLEEQAKKLLMIWPYHTLIGTPGHSITPALYEAIAYHTAARDSQPNFVIKGKTPQTEHYSIFETEIKTQTSSGDDLNTTLLDHLATYDEIYIAGQAKSHCVLESVASIMRYFSGNKVIIGKFIVLTDAMSSVVSPGIDFEALANETFSAYEKDGLRFATTKDSLG